ncbi:hypothetical protein ERO13_D09G183800v2 [Gossypium hirsutum]|uniref:Dof zinc finger protein n=1 Tax=Gossypium hirsutum TaxID=3635 RepID=A0A1U8I4S5_GOSHI|nr:dof zinc finger protein DOF1.8-like isoform X1 [Gossypium hirsutum]KAG4131063.1 hypothetical protein ERO13_D09G183800v2 [Gossypium hirsutum]
MDTALWPQEIVTNACSKPADLERKAAAKPQKQQALNCPRCNSMNTKFCYYNNYSLRQPRYFCKTCRRYWTEGGSLRNIPVGGCSRKTKRSSSSSKKLPDLVNNPKIHGGQDLNLAYPVSEVYTTSMSEFVKVPNSSVENSKKEIPSSLFPRCHVSALELVTGMSSKGWNPFIPMPVPDPNTVYTPGFPLQEYKPTLNSCVDGAEEINGRLLFPFQDLKQTTDNEDNKEQGDSSAGFWNGMLGGASW